MGLHTDMNAKEIESIVREAGQILLSAHLQQEDVHRKAGPANFVTDYDLRIQSFLIGKLSEACPDAAFFGEEDTEGNRYGVGDGLTFFIDPIDGTTNFLFDYRNSCVSVGLAEHGALAAGWVFDPYAERMYSAVRGDGAFLNGRRLRMEDRSIDDGIVAFGCARYNDGGAARMARIVEKLFLGSLAIRNGGSAAIDLCRIAGGSNAGYIELLLQPYDYAAASVIIREAGGVITQPDGSPVTLDKPCPVIAGTKTAHKEILEIYAETADSAERSG